MNRLARPYGFGRMAVKEADIDSVTYLSKYLTKSFMRDNPSFGSHRRWGPIGGFKGTRCKDAIYDTPMTRNHKKLFAGLQIGYKEFRLVAQYSDVFGDFGMWPLEVKIRFTKVMQSYGHEKSFV